MIITAGHGAIAYLDTGLFVHRFAHIVNPRDLRHPAGDLLERSGLPVRAGRAVAHWSGTYTVAVDGLCIGDSNGYRGRTAEILCDRATGRFCQLNHLSATKGCRIDSEEQRATATSHTQK